MKIHSLLALSLILLQLNFSVCAQEDDHTPSRRNDVGVMGLIWSVPIGTGLVFLINTKTTPGKEKESDGFFSGNFGISKNLEGKQTLPQNNSFFSASIGHFTVGYPRYSNHNNYELQIEFEYLQDINIQDSEKVNLLQAFLSNINAYTSEDSAFYLGFGMGGGKLDIRSLLNGDTELSDPGYIVQFRAGRIFQLPAEEFRLNLGYRGLMFFGGIDSINSHRLETGLEYKWK